MKLAHYHRFPFYDYSRGASLFVSLSTEPRRRLFGEVVEGGEMRLSPFGREVLVAIEFTFAKAPGFTLFGHTVLPDHCHFRFYLAPGVENARAAALMNTVVGRFKSYTTHLYQTKYGGVGVLWQEGFHDWLCLSREMIDAVERYIAYNALKWWLRNGGGRALMALHEPLRSPRFGQGEFWRGLGAVGLLDRPGTEARALQDEAAAPNGAGEGRLMVALRVSRRCGALMPAIAEGRLAIIARGNSPEEISRAACLDYNCCLAGGCG